MTRRLPRLVVLLLLADWGLVQAAEPDVSPSPSLLQPPTAESRAALDKALMEFDRSAGTVVADVGARSVTWGDVADAIRGMPPVVASLPLQQLYQTIIVKLIEDKALADRAVGFGLQRDLTVQRHMKTAAELALVEDFIHRTLAANLTESALRKTYDENIAGKPGPDEVSARIIAVDTKEEASTLIGRLQAGEDFGGLARAFSKDETAQGGGDLGFVRREMMQTGIGAVMFSLGVGQTTVYPVQNGLRWYIIRVDARRQRPTPSFDEVRAILARDVTEAGVREVRQQILKAVRVQFYGMAGKQGPEKPQ